VSQQLGALQTHTTDTFFFISHTTNVLLFKFICNIFIGVIIIKEMLGSVASGTPCIMWGTSGLATPHSRTQQADRPCSQPSSAVIRNAVLRSPKFVNYCGLMTSHWTLVPLPRSKYALIFLLYIFACIFVSPLLTERKVCNIFSFIDFLFNLFSYINIIFISTLAGLTSWDSGSRVRLEQCAAMREKGLVA